MKKIVSALVLFLTFSMSSFAQSHDKVYAVFIVNFAKFTQWPANRTTGEFVIGVFGNSPIKEELKAAAAIKTIGTQKIVIKDCQSPKDGAGCNLVFVTENKSSIIHEVIGQLNAEPTLIVTEKEGFAKNGGGISFSEASGKVKFEINKKAIEKKGLSVSTSLTNLGTVVED